MPYDVTILTVRTGATRAGLGTLEAWLGKRSEGNLLACWTSEIGALNRVMLIREFGSEEAMAAERQQIALDPDPYGLGDVTLQRESNTFVPLPFVPPPRAGAFGKMFEARDYVMNPGGLAPTMKLWEAQVHQRIALSPIYTAMYATTGNTPRLLHIWPWPGLDERAATRGKAMETGAWPPKGGPGHIASQQVEIYLPVPFSPAH